MKTAITSYLRIAIISFLIFNVSSALAGQCRQEMLTKTPSARFKTKVQYSAIQSQESTYRECLASSLKTYREKWSLLKQNYDLTRIDQGQAIKTIYAESSPQKFEAVITAFYPIYNRVYCSGDSELLSSIREGIHFGNQGRMPFYTQDFEYKAGADTFWGCHDLVEKKRDAMKRKGIEPGQRLFIDYSGPTGPDSNSPYAQVEIVIQNH